MSVYNLEKIFAPAVVAVIGASETPESIGRILMENLSGTGYEGQVVPVNPKHSKILGIKAYKTISDFEGTADLAVIATPISTVPEIMQECVDAGVGGTIVISAGGRETGEQGKKLEKKIKAEAHKGGLRIIGPNCMGIICPHRRLNASFAGQMPKDGQAVFISQSGAICSAVLDLAVKEKMGFRYVVSIGSMLDVDFGDLIDYLGGEPEVKSILLYIESLKEIRKFMSAAREVSRIKPIVALKAGKSEQGAQAASSHTGAMAGEEGVYAGAFQRAGLAQVRSLEEFFDSAELLAKESLPSGRRLVVVTNAGGPGVMAADAVETFGLELTTLEEDTLAGLDDLLPPHWSRGNPIDILGDADPERYSNVVKYLYNAGKIDGMLIIVNPQAMTDPTRVAQALADELNQKPFPVFTCLMGGRDVEKGRAVLNNNGFPTYDTPERAVRSMALLCDYAANREMLMQIPSKFRSKAATDEEKARRLLDTALKNGRNNLSEVESKAFLAAYGIPVNRTETAANLDEAVELAADMGYPLVMKIHSPDITHKTEVGGVRKNLMNEQDVRNAYHQMIKQIEESESGADITGVTLQPMIRDSEAELLIGAKKDPQFGPVILFGMGGIFTEIIADRNIALPPLNRNLARALIKQSRAYKVLKGYRNRPPADMKSLEQLLVSLSHVLIDFPEITALDMNPVLVQNSKPTAVDAAVMIEKTDVVSPGHLIIRPYPEEYEAKETTRDGVDLFIRPIKPEDAPLLIDLFENLSPQSRYHRFFSPVKKLSRDLLIRLTQIDYDRQICLIALDREAGDEKMLGVGRVIMGPDRHDAEFSVAVGDPWQGRGIGRKLLEHCIRAGRDSGVKILYGHVLSENRQMIHLGRELGMAVNRNDDPGEFHLRMDLNR